MALIVARIFWAKEIKVFENIVFESIGLGGGYKYIVLAPLASYICYKLFKKEKLKANSNNTTVIGTKVIIFSVASLIIALAYLMLFVGQ